MSHRENAQGGDKSSPGRQMGERGRRPPRPEPPNVNEGEGPAALSAVVLGGHVGGACVAGRPQSWAAGGPQRAGEGAVALAADQAALSRPEPLPRLS